MYKILRNNIFCIFIAIIMAGVWASSIHGTDIRQTGSADFRGTICRSYVQTLIPATEENMELTSVSASSAGTVVQTGHKSESSQQNTGHDAADGMESRSDEHPGCISGIPSFRMADYYVFALERIIV